MIYLYRIIGNIHGSESWGCSVIFMAEIWPIWHMVFLREMRSKQYVNSVTECYRMLQTQSANNYLLISFLPIVIE